MTTILYVFDKTDGRKIKYSLPDITEPVLSALCDLIRTTAAATCLDVILNASNIAFTSEYVDNVNYVLDKDHLYAIEVNND